MRLRGDVQAHEWYWVLGMLAAVIGMALAVLAIPANADPGDIEARAYTPALPDPEVTIGAGVAWQFAEIDPDWWLIGDLWPGHGLFVDALYVGGGGHVGGSMSTRPMDKDDGWRVFASAWWEGGAQWTAGASRRLATW